MAACLNIAAHIRPAKNLLTVAAIPRTRSNLADEIIEVIAMSGEHRQTQDLLLEKGLIQLVHDK